MTSFTVNSLHICWNLDVTFTLCQTRSHGAFRGSVPKFSCAQKFVLNIYLNKNKNLAPYQFCPPNLATGLFYASLYFQNCGILSVLTSEFANVSDFSPHIIFAVS